MPIGILLNNLGVNQAAYCFVRAAHEYVTEHNDEVILFYEELIHPCMPLKVCSLNMKQAFGYNAPVIATDLATARKLINFPGPTKKIFYIFDLQWLRRRPADYSDFVSVYRHPSLRLVCRSDQHAEIVSDVWNVNRPLVYSDNNLKNLLENVAQTANN